MGDDRPHGWVCRSRKYEVTVLVNGAERGTSIDREAARKAYSEAEARFNQTRGGSDRKEQNKADKALRRARARLQAAGGVQP